MESFKSCSFCKEGYIHLKDENGMNYVVKCDCLKKHQDKVYVEYYFNKSNLPLYIKDYDIGTYLGKDSNHNISKVKKFISDFEDKFKDISLQFYYFI